MPRGLVSGIAAVAVAVAAGLVVIPRAAAETLTDALIRAYQTSPLLDASRAGLRGVDESVPQARAARRPQVSAFGSASATRRLDGGAGESDALTAGLRASLLIYDSGQTEAAIESARHSVAAARADLRNVEQVVLFNVVEAFMDVRRDQQFVALAQGDVRVLEEQLRAARERFEVGEITRTDVSQTEARLAASRAQLVSAQGALEVSRAAYQAATGAMPGPLQPPPPLPELPRSLEQATEIGLRHNPEIVAAQFLERAAVFDFDRARAASRLSVQAEGDIAWRDSSAPGGRQRDAFASAGLSASVPLSTGGRDSSLIRQAQTVVERRQWELQDAARSTRAAVASAWAQLEVARAQITAWRQQIEAARVAAEGVAEEARVGLRSTLDVLDADQEVLEAEANLVQAARDEYVAGYNLLRAMGLLTVEHLGLGIETYDPDVNFMRVQAGPRGGYATEVVDRIRARWE